MFLSLCSRSKRTEGGERRGSGSLAKNISDKMSEKGHLWYELNNQNLPIKIGWLVLLMISKGLLMDNRRPPLMDLTSVSM